MERSVSSLPHSLILRTAMVKSSPLVVAWGTQPSDHGPGVDATLAILAKASGFLGIFRVKSAMLPPFKGTMSSR